MNREVPKDIDILLEQAEIDTDGVIVVNISERAFVHKALNLLDRTSVDEGVIDDDLQPALLSFVEQRFPLLDRAGERFFDPDVLPGFQGFESQRIVRSHRSGDNHGVNGGIIENLAVITGGLDTRVTGFAQRQSGGVQITDLQDQRLLALHEISDQIGAPVAIADNACIQHILSL